MIKISKFEIYRILHPRLIAQSKKLKEIRFHFWQELFNSQLFNTYGRSYSNELVQKQIEKIIFYYLNEKDEVCDIAFKELCYLELDVATKHLFVNINNELYPLLTPKNKKHKERDDYEEIVLNDLTLRSLTINHNPPFEDFVKENRSNLNTLFEISKIVNPSLRKTRDIQVKIAEQLKNQPDKLDKLWSELEFIIEQQPLEMVHRKYNTRKYNIPKNPASVDLVQFVV